MVTSLRELGATRVTLSPDHVGIEWAGPPADVQAPLSAEQAERSAAIAAQRAKIERDKLAAWSAP